MQALIQGKSKLVRWFEKTAHLLIRRGGKESRKLKGKPTKLTAWKIIQLLA